MRGLIPGFILSFFAATAGAATSLYVDIPSATTTGVAFQFTVTARNGTTTDPAFTGAVHFTSSDSTATLPGDYTFTPGDAGTHTFTATMGSAGSGSSSATHTITATSVASPSVYGMDATLVSWNDNVVRLFYLQVPATVDRAVPFQVVVQALNAGHSVVSGYRGTVHFTPTRSEQVPADYTFTASDAGTHTFNVTATMGHYSSFGVVDAADSSVFGDSVQITVNCPELTVTAWNSGPVCSMGGAAVLFASPNMPVVDYHWFSSIGHPPVFDSHQQNPIVEEPYTYIVVVRESNECEATARTTVFVHYPESFNVSISPSALCGPGNITASVTNGSLFDNYNWLVSGGTITSGEGTASIVATPAQGSSSVSLELHAREKSSGCNAYQYLGTVPVGSGNLSAHISTVATMCAQTMQTASVTDAGAGATYAWTIMNGSIVSGQGTHMILYTSTGGNDVTLTVAVSNGGCQGTDSTVVSSMSTPAITDEPQDTTVLPGQSATLSVTATGADLHYAWYEGTGDRTKLVGSQASFMTPRLGQTTSYWVDITNGCGNAASRTVVVTVGGKRRTARH